VTSAIQDAFFSILFVAVMQNSGLLGLLGNVRQPSIRSHSGHTGGSPG
jgi:hypothetical protein